MLPFLEFVHKFLLVIECLVFVKLFVLNSFYIFLEFNEK